MCEQFDLDNQGNRITIAGTNITGREWVCKFMQYRFGMYKMNLEVEGAGLSYSNYKSVRLEEPSPPVSGTYKLFFNNSQAIQVNVNGAWTDNIPYNYHGYHIVQGLERLLQKNFYSFDYANQEREYDGRKMTIYFRDVKGNLPLITADDSNLAGGITKPTVSVIKLRTGSNALLFEPIANDMLFEPSDRPQISVKVSKYNVQSTCAFGYDCSYVVSA